MKAEYIVDTLLEGNAEMIQHLGRIAINPAYEIEDAITRRMPFEKVYDAREEYKYRIRIDIKPPEWEGSKNVFISVRFNRIMALGAYNGGGYGPYPIAKAKEIAALLQNMVYAAQHATPMQDMQSLYYQLTTLQWVPRNPRRRKKVMGYYRESAPEGIVKDLLVGAAGFGGIMQKKSSFNPNLPTLAHRYEWSRDWNHAGEITVRVFDYGPQSERPNTLRLSMDWIMARGGMRGVNVELNLWDIDESKKVKIVYILREGIAELIAVADRMENQMQQVHTYQEDESMRSAVQAIFNRISHRARQVTDGFELI